MTHQRFIEMAIAKVAEIEQEHCNEAVFLIDVFVVWSCKTLQNSKAILCTKTSNRLYEATMNGDKDEIYIDTYDKVSNICVPTYVTIKQ